jgi:hypothetical protein
MNLDGVHPILSGGSLNLTGRYIQYQAAMATADWRRPALESIAFVCSTDQRRASVRIRPV